MLGIIRPLLRASASPAFALLLCFFACSSAMTALRALAFAAIEGASVQDAQAVDRDSLLLEVQIDEVEAAEEQPIQLVVCVTNVGSRPFENLAPLRPTDRFLELRLSRDGRLGSLPIGGAAGSGTARSPAPALRPGESSREVLNLLDWFGAWKREGHELSWAIGQMTLMPGRYRLSAVYRARAGTVSGLDPYTVTSPSVSFEIKPRRAFPSEDLLLDRFLSDGTFPASDIAGLRARGRKWLPEFYGSRYFFLIYYCTGLETPGLSSESILAGLRGAGSGSVREAPFVGLRCKMEPDRGRSLAWIGRIGTDANSGLMRKVIGTWERRLREVPKDHSSPE
jgi:hypothetical protein